ncbi:GGDEF domain-containing protein [Pleionea litopenaei]|uniref:diguanylate cyclase n=1 Tax=Pleionea litopenaei TaxID=3070815 RepID=A0AA51RVC4_9GAMM|nr:diguanylate cyclase [Pleionea sp. HL-JVS1]WMS88338.1 diguanylate cyclase [Pleionea sp. HL-JVS1]
MSRSELDKNEIDGLHWMMDMLTNVDVGLVVLDSAYCIQMWNRFMHDHSGKSDLQVKGMSIFDVFPEVPEAWFKHKIDSVFLLKSRAFSTWEQRPYLFRFKNYRPITGTEDTMYQNATMIPLMSSDGDVNHVCLLIYDVTDVATSKKELTRLNSELESLSRTDRLTQLYNRGFWEESFQGEFDRCMRYKHVSSALIFDIDHFKSVNDTFGHQAGDEVIRQTAKTLKDMVRKSDIPGRYGGEEFVVFLPNTPADNALIFAERLRKRIEALKVSYEGKPIPFTVSIGICEFSEKMPSHEKWIEMADQALYQSKEGGRNQTNIKQYS